MSLLSEWHIMFIHCSPVDEDVPDSHFLLRRCPKFALNFLLIQRNHTYSELCFACSWFYVGSQPYILCLYVWMCFMTLHKQNLAPLPSSFLRTLIFNTPRRSPTFMCVYCVHLPCCQFDPTRFAAVSPGTRTRVGENEWRCLGWGGKNEGKEWKDDREGAGCIGMVMG